jgi:tetratricopeptide (TPR) repeat protein
MKHVRDEVRPHCLATISRLVIDAWSVIGGGWRYIVLLAATIGVYFPALRAGFILDDDKMVTDNRLVAAADGLRQFWFTTRAEDYWPVTSTSLWVEWRLWGLNPLGYHVTNIALHCAAVLILWRILARLNVPGAWFAALLFAVHPLNVESVTWIAQRKNLLAMFFFLLSVRWFLNTGIVDYVEANVGERNTWCNRWYLLSLFAFVLAMLSKESVAPMPIILLGAIAWLRRPLWRDLARLAPFFAVAAVLVVVEIWFQRHVSLETIRTEGVLQRLLGAGAVVWFYLLKALWPAKLIFVYPKWHIVAAQVAWWLPLSTAIGLTGILWGARRSWGKTTLFAWGYFCAMLIPVLGFADVYFMRYSLVADHYAHLALIGIVVWAAAVGSTLLQRIPIVARACWKIPIAVIIAGLVVALGDATWRRNLEYRDAMTLYTTTLKANPDSTLMHLNLGYLEQQRGNNAEAMAHFQAALRLDPSMPNVHLNLGAVLFAMGRVPEAIAEDEIAVRLNPAFAKGHVNLGLALAAANRGSEAIAEYQSALALDPQLAEAAFFLGLSFVQANRFEEAIASYERALAIRPIYDVAENNLGVALCYAGRVKEAVPHYQQAIRISPASFEAHYNLGFALSGLGRTAEAISAFRKAVNLAPANTAAINALGNAFFVSGRIDEASEQFTAVIRLDPRNADAHNNLGICLAAKEQLDTALTEFETAVRIRPDFAEAEANVGHTLQAQGNPEAALPHIQRAVQLQEAVSTPTSRLNAKGPAENQGSVPTAT